MGAQHKTVAEYEHEIDSNRERLTAPHDGAMFYTNGAREKAVDYSRNNHQIGRETKTIEGVSVESTRDDEKPGAYGTPYGAELDQQNLFRNNDPVTRQLNKNYADMLRAKTPEAKIDETEGARAVWDKASRVYAEQSSGKVEVFTNGDHIRKNSFFARIERHILIKNEKVTSINGIDRKDLEALLEKGGPEANQEINSRIENGNENRKTRFEQMLRNGVDEASVDHQNKKDRDTRMSKLATTDPSTHRAIVDIRKKMVKLSAHSITNPDARAKLGNAITDRLLKYHESGKNVQELVKQPSRINRAGSGPER